MEVLEAIPEGRDNAVDSLYLSALFGQDVTPHLSNLYKQGKVRREKINNLFRYWKDHSNDDSRVTGCRPLSVQGKVVEIPGVGRLITWNGIKETFNNGCERYTFTCLGPDPKKPDRYREATVVVAWGFSLG